MQTLFLILIKILNSTFLYFYFRPSPKVFLSVLFNPDHRQLWLDYASAIKFCRLTARMLLDTVWTRYISYLKSLVSTVFASPSETGI